VYCSLKFADPAHNQNYGLTKITIARAYGNLIRYFGDRFLARAILKKSIEFIQVVERTIRLPQATIKRSEDNILRELETLRKSEGGKIFLSFHYGLFELLPLILSEYLNMPIHVIVDSLALSQQNRINQYKELIHKVNPEAKVDFIVVQDAFSVLKVINILRNKGMVFIYIDENKSLNNSSADKLRAIPFIHGHSFFVRTSVPYFLGKSVSTVYSILSVYGEDKFDLSINEITNSQEQNFSDRFYQNVIRSLIKALIVSPEQWTRWYCVDELDELHSSELSNDEPVPHDSLLIIDRERETKFNINIPAMTVRQVM